MKLIFRTLTLESWKSFEKLFGKTGACAGCWCMYWLMPRKEYDEKRKDGRTKKRMRRIVKEGVIPGIIAFDKETPVGWIAIQPRSSYPVLANSRILAPVDDKPVWSIVCFYVDKNYRRKGIATKLIKHAVSYAKKNKAIAVEGYPVEPKSDNAAPVFIYTGTASSFRKAGFREVLRRSETRPIMRFYIE